MERWSVFPPFLFLHPKTVSDSDGNNLLLLLFAGFGFGQFMDVHYDKVCDLILRHKESKDSIIRKTVITLIPHMAAYDPQGFCDEHHSGGERERERKDGGRRRDVPARPGCSPPRMAMNVLSSVERFMFISALRLPLSAMNPTSRHVWAVTS